MKKKEAKSLVAFPLLGALCITLCLACASTKPDQQAPKTETPSPQAAPPDTAAFEEKVVFAYPAVIVNRKINLRGGPGTHYAITETLSGGQSVTVVSESGEWVKVLVDKDNKMGWIHKSLIRRKK